MIDGWGISCRIAHILFTMDFTDDQSTLVQVMAWSCQATSLYMSQCWPRWYGVTRPEWVKEAIQVVTYVDIPHICSVLKSSNRFANTKFYIFCKPWYGSHDHEVQLLFLASTSNRLQIPLNKKFYSSISSTICNFHLGIPSKQTKNPRCNKMNIWYKANIEGHVVSRHRYNFIEAQLYNENVW